MPAAAALFFRQQAGGSARRERDLCLSFKRWIRTAAFGKGARDNDWLAAVLGAYGVSLLSVVERRFAPHR